MKVRTARRPSPAMVIAMIALCLGLGGSAIAAGDLTKSQVKKIAKKQAIKQIDAKAGSLSVANAQNAVNAVTAQKASNIFGASSVNDEVTAATLPGTTVDETSNTSRYTFPRSVQGCVPVASGTFEDDASAVLGGTGNPNSVDVTTPSGSGNSVIVICP